MNTVLDGLTAVLAGIHPAPPADSDAMNFFRRSEFLTLPRLVECLLHCLSSAFVRSEYLQFCSIGIVLLAGDSEVFLVRVGPGLWHYEVLRLEMRIKK